MGDGFVQGIHDTTIYSKKKTFTEILQILVKNLC